MDYICARLLLSMLLMGLGVGARQRKKKGPELVTNTENSSQLISLSQQSREEDLRRPSAFA